jgi:hypothetical protein
MPLQPIIISSPEREKWLNEHVPYRIKALQALNVFVASGGRLGPLEPVFPNLFEGTVIACRWTASFLGLYVDRQGILKQVADEKKRTGLLAVHLGGSLIDPCILSEDERKLLTTVVKGASIATAHPTKEGIHAMTWDDV